MESPMAFRLSHRSGVPPYLQLVQQVEHALRIGELSVGDQLPRIKDVVAELAINPNTVLKAYRELEHKGITGGRPGQGTFIVAAPEVAGVAEMERLRKRLVEGWLTEASDAGLDEEAVVAVFNAALRDFERRATPARQASARSRRGIA